MELLFRDRREAKLDYQRKRGEVLTSDLIFAISLYLDAEIDLFVRILEHIAYEGRDRDSRPLLESNWVIEAGRFPTDGDIRPQLVRQAIKALDKEPFEAFASDVIRQVQANCEELTGTYKVEQLALK